MPNLLWLQTGACSGDSMSLLCTENPNLFEILSTYQIDLLWHPSLSLDSVSELLKKIHKIENNELGLNILCVEGSILTGPDGTGMYDTIHRRPKMDIVQSLCQKADYVIAMGTCASYGGIPAAPPNPTDALGLQYFKDEPGGLLEHDWKSKSGYPVINLAGCPVHPSIMVETLVMILSGVQIELDHIHRPVEFYNSIIHQGCTRNEYHEFDVEDSTLGGNACMFFNLGCQAPYTSGLCNVKLWNKRGSKTRIGTPCFGCTTPRFPLDRDLFATKKIGDIPAELPLGVKRANYMAYKGLAKAATPQRLNDRQTKV